MSTAFSYKPLQIPVDEPAQVTPQPRQARRKVISLVSEHVRVLVIDDEVLIGRALKRMLNKYEVVSVQHPHDAYSLLSEGTFDVILCDVMMPEITGKDVYETIKRDYPGLEQKIIFMTGAVFSRSAEFLENIDNDRMEKPFERATLLELLSKHIPI